MQAKPSSSIVTSWFERADVGWRYNNPLRETVLSSSLEKLIIPGYGHSITAGVLTPNLNHLEYSSKYFNALNSRDLLPSGL
jgi:hypothetical protein